ncbi:hypothetical protein OJF2_70510 [Aquisphaera giovannonii]|uniref:Uncharacterized protein n=1 Tax=Aquisphaera giovannonii TaxID=406548 RepID=A0A5B9WCQ8_9BACT|nr:hypothetical protein OJF2_70510 [Aquisphaera giovannonii]
MHAATSANGRKVPAAAIPKPSRRVRAYQTSSACGGRPSSTSGPRSGSSGKGVPITSKATAEGREGTGMGQASWCRRMEAGAISRTNSWITRWSLVFSAAARKAGSDSFGRPSA